MKRLTSKRDWIEAGKDLSNEWGYSHIWRRLKQVEDILGDTYDLDRMRELVEADKAGRCVVLPVKPGDTVWYLTGNPSMTNRLCFDRVDSARVVGFYFDERGMQVRLDYFHGSHGTYGFYEKTVFSTHKAAEAALAKEADLRKNGFAENAGIWVAENWLAKIREDNENENIQRV